MTWTRTAARTRAIIALSVALMLAAAVPADTLLKSGPDTGAVHHAVRAYVPGPDDAVPVIIQAAGSTDSVVAAVERLGGEVLRQYDIIPAVEATLPSTAVEALAADPAVSRISLDASVIATGKKNGKDRDRGDNDDADDDDDDRGGRPYDRDDDDDDDDRAGRPYDRDDDDDDDDRGGWPYESDDAGPDSVFPAVVGATDVWAAGVTGRAVGIAILDTGVTEEDTDLEDRVVKRKSFAPGKRDVSGHGTHVAGIAAGNGENSDGRYMGIAPGANIIAVKVGNADGARIGDVIAGLEWVLDRREKLNIRVVNLSFTSSVTESYFKSPLDAAVEQVWFSGIVVVVSAGNRGSDAFAVDYPPANDPFVITVGAFSDNATIAGTDDYLKSWSSRGVSHDGVAKPELVAPGSRLIATLGNDNAELVKQYPENRVGEHYFRMGGTSAAAPVVSGVVALMLEANPGLTPDQVKARLLAGADPLAGSPSPRLDAVDAVLGPGAGLANQGVATSLWIDPATRAIADDPASLDSITWDSITWDSITWDSITWDSITWDSITWDSVIYD